MPLPPSLKYIGIFRSVQEKILWESVGSERQSIGATSTSHRPGRKKHSRDRTLLCSQWSWFATLWRRPDSKRVDCRRWLIPRPFSFESPRRCSSRGQEGLAEFRPLPVGSSSEPRFAAIGNGTRHAVIGSFHRTVERCTDVLLADTAPGQVAAPTSRIGRTRATSQSLRFCRPRDGLRKYKEIFHMNI